MSPAIREVIGFRGEKILELCLTNYENLKQPLFRPGFLGDKWPTNDFYVELVGLKNNRPYFLGQVKSTSVNLLSDAAVLKIATKKQDVKRLKQIPGPTYVFGVHEPTERVFVKSVHSNSPTASISQIPIGHELTPSSLRLLRDEVQQFWKSTAFKPSTSIFS